jgi:4'-phosphopantetheinyl transferase
MNPSHPTAASWCSPGEFPTFSQAAVHVWRVGLDVRGEAVAGLLDLLCAEEREQAHRLRTEDLRRRFIVRRARLRQLLARYLAASPAEIRFDRGAYGKPALPAPWSDSRIEFSASHSAEIALVAVGRGRALGVDIERIRPLPDFQDLSRNYFARFEADLLSRLPEAERLAAFFRTWARKEAVLKALGTGLSLGLDQVEVSLECEPARIVAIRGDRVVAAAWHLEDLPPAPGFAAALACGGGNREGARARPSTELFQFPAETA